MTGPQPSVSVSRCLALAPDASITAQWQRRGWILPQNFGNKYAGILRISTYKASQITHNKTETLPRLHIAHMSSVMIKRFKHKILHKYGAIQWLNLESKTPSSQTTQTIDSSQKALHQKLITLRSRSLTWRVRSRRSIKDHIHRPSGVRALKIYLPPKSRPYVKCVIPR